MASRQSATVARSAQFAVETLEQRTFFDVTVDTGFGWSVTQPTGVAFDTFKLVGPAHDHLLIKETVNLTGTAVALTFKKTTLPSGVNRPIYFALDARFFNNDPAGTANHFSWTIVHFGNNYPSSDNTADHPHWAHFHVMDGRLSNLGGSITPINEHPKGQMQKIDITNLNVPQGGMLQLGGGTLTATGSTAPENGFRMHFGNDYPGNSFDLYQSLSYDPPKDRFEDNDNFNQATDLGKIDHARKDNLTIHKGGGYESNPDFFKFKALNTRKMEIKTLFSHVQGDLDMFIFDSTQHVVGSSFGWGDNASVTINTQANATYYVKVFGKDDTATQRNYSLVINTVYPNFFVPINLHQLQSGSTRTSDGVFNGSGSVSALPSIDMLDATNTHVDSGKLFGTHFL